MQRVVAVAAPGGGFLGSVACVAGRWTTYDVLTSSRVSNKERRDAMGKPTSVTLFKVNEASASAHLYNWAYIGDGQHSHTIVEIEKKLLKATAN